MAEADIGFFEGLPVLVVVLIGVEHSLDYTFAYALKDKTASHIAAAMMQRAHQARLLRQGCTGQRTPSRVYQPRGQRRAAQPAHDPHRT